MADCVETVECNLRLWYSARYSCPFPPLPPPLAVDLLVEGAYTRRMVAAPDTGGDIVSAVWAFVMVGALVASGLVGIVAHRDAALFWWVATPFAAQVVVPIAAGWVGEERAVRGARGGAVVAAHREVFGVGGLVAAGAVGLAAASLWGSPVVQAAVSVSTSAVLCGVSLWLLPPLMGTYPGSLSSGGAEGERGGGQRGRQRACGAR